MRSPILNERLNVLISKELHLDGYIQSHFYHESAGGGIRSPTLLEPVMVVTLGTIVGFIVIALFMPMVSLLQSVGK